MFVRKALKIILLCTAFLAVAVGIYFLPPVHARLAWRVEDLALRIQYQLHPPAQEVFVPQQSGTDQPQASPTPVALPSATATLIPTQQVVLSPTPEPSPIPTQAVTPLPSQVTLKGVVYEDQHGRYNYCAPANLSMALSYWGWKGNRDVVGPFLKPDDKDKNVMPYEMADYVLEQTDLKVVLRVGGDLETIKRFLVNGFPVVVEKGTYLRDLTGVVSWMGHYQVVTGFDDAQGIFITQDSFVEPDHDVTYEDMTKGWRAFNYTYLVIYPADKEPQVMELLGADADETANFQNAYLKASNEVYGLAGIEQYFAWYNLGSSLVNLQDYAGAAAAYDESFAIYPALPETERPWRMLWYQTGPYFAYFHSQRYYDALYLADGTLSAMQGEKNLEESYYWRGMARAALGETEAAIEDYRACLQYHPGFEPAIYQLRLLGVENP